jgi:hypothetical protein
MVPVVTGMRTALNLSEAYTQVRRPVVFSMGQRPTPPFAHDYGIGPFVDEDHLGHG